MKIDEANFNAHLSGLALMNGKAAKQKSRRLAVILKVKGKIQAPELDLEAEHLKKAVNYHLRQAAIIGRQFEKMTKQKSDA